MQFMGIIPTGWIPATGVIPTTLVSIPDKHLVISNSECILTSPPPFKICTTKSVTKTFLSFSCDIRVVNVNSKQCLAFLCEALDFLHMHILFSCFRFLASRVFYFPILTLFLNLVWYNHQLSTPACTISTSLLILTFEMFII
jgi:hypothetical protein